MSRETISTIRNGANDGAAQGFKRQVGSGQTVVENVDRVGGPELDLAIPQLASDASLHWVVDDDGVVAVKFRWWTVEFAGGDGEVAIVADQAQAELTGFGHRWSQDE